MDKPKSMQSLLDGMRQYGASDLHLKVHVPPYYRIAGRLRKLDTPELESSEQVETMVRPLISEAMFDQFKRCGSLDFSYADKHGDRFRVNMYRAKSDTHVAFRRIHSVIPTYEALHLPPIYHDLMERSYEGLILVGGVTGCGKSTTLAAMIEHVISTRPVHVVTLEDPIEYNFHTEKAIFAQREIGLDVPSFHDGLRFMLREDPDVVFIGEMRDRETMLAAIQSAETGHLVFGSIHTQDCAQTLSRILEFFPHEDHDFVRSSLAASLAAVMCQRLLPAVDTKIGRVPATEVLIANSTVREKVRKGEDEDIEDIIASSTEEGMRSFTFSLAEMVRNDMIDMKTALEYAPNREALDSQIKGIQLSRQTMIHRVKR